MNFHVEKNGSKRPARSGKFYFQVDVGPNPMIFENYMRRVFAGVGLRGESIKAFGNFIGQPFFYDMVSNAKSNAAVADAVLNPKGHIIKVTVGVSASVSASIVEKLRRFGINLLVNNKGVATFHGYAPTHKKKVERYQNFTPAPEKSVSQWTTVEKLDSVIRRAALLLPEEVGNQLLGLLSPVALAAMTVVLIIWIGGHFFVASEIADVALLIVGGIFLGVAAFQAGGLLANFAIKCVDGRTEKDLDESDQHLAEAIALIGVQTVIALLLAKAPKVFRESKITMNKSAPVLNIKTMPPLPRTPGKLFYKPKLQSFKGGYPGEGVTFRSGDSFYSTLGAEDIVAAARIHEKVHQFLTPKLQILREFRVVLKSNSYSKSYVLRYLEEALAQTVAEISVYGIGKQQILNGISFPVKNGYVTVTKMSIKATGVLLGPINVGGTIYKVYFNYSKPDDSDWEEMK